MFFCSDNHAWFPTTLKPTPNGSEFHENKTHKKWSEHLRSGFFEVCLPISFPFSPPSTEGHRLAGPSPSPPATSQGPCGPGRLRAHCGAGARDPGAVWLSHDISGHYLA